jgi:lipopolysaccharide/colanic/teichoic acid biosynthesis glycosyltransferase
MELGTTAKRTTGKFRYIQTRIEPEEFQAPRPEASSFFYIGKNYQNIKWLLGQFDSGFCSGDLKSAAAMITKLALKKECMPDMIVMDLNCKEEDIQVFRKSVLQLSKTLAATPIVLGSHLISQELMSLVRRKRLVDDIVRLGEGEASLYDKTDFLKRIKLFSEKQSGRKVILEDSMQSAAGLNWFFKRSFDIIVASAAILLLLPVFLLIALCVKLESNGPIFYNSYRAGRGFKIFKFFKFRTMYVGADSKVDELANMNQYSVGGQVFFKANNDPRVTRVGALLRNSSLDELPQLLNVLMGDMSIVGNRPLPLYEASALTTNELADRFLAPAGITGLWQIKKRGCHEMSTLDRINLDIDYANKYNFMYDLWIVANTPPALIQKANV